MIARCARILLKRSQLNVGVRRMRRLNEEVRVRSLLVAVLVVSSGCEETVTASYPTYADAERAGAVARGWIPSFVPRSATEIREVHDLDTNQQWLRFRVPQGDTSVAVGASVIPLTTARQTGSAPPSGMNPWLPELRDPPLVTPRAGIRAYRHSRTGLGAACVALDAQESVAYAWSCEPGPA